MTSKWTSQVARWNLERLDKGILLYIIHACRVGGHACKLYPHSDRVAVHTRLGNMCISY